MTRPWFQRSTLLVAALALSLPACVVEGEETDHVLTGQDYELEEVEVELEGALGGGEEVGDDEARGVELELEVEGAYAPNGFDIDIHDEMEPDPEPWKNPDDHED